MVLRYLEIVGEELMLNPRPPGSKGLLSTRRRFVRISLKGFVNEVQEVYKTQNNYEVARVLTPRKPIFVKVAAIDT